MESRTSSRANQMMLNGTLKQVMAMLSIMLALLVMPVSSSWAQDGGGLLDDTEEKKDDAKDAGGGLLDDSDDEPAAGGGLLDDSDDKPAAGGGLLDDSDDKPKSGGGLLDDTGDKPDSGGGLLDDTGDAKPAAKPDGTGGTEGSKVDPTDPHGDLFATEKYPRAAACAKCHRKIYDEWRVSNHAYASLSPMFHKFEQRINELAQGTIGYFCMRCHATVGTELKEERHLPLWKRARVSREGITCITCHRVGEQYNKVNGARRIVQGPISDSVKGAHGSQGFDVVAKDKGELMKKMGVHDKPMKFAQIGKSEFCVSCHQVAVHPGIKLEVVWEQYRASPAAKKGVTCQQCHMGKVPGVAAGFDKAPAAIVNGQASPVRDHHDHSFFGPGYPIAHPGVFPHNSKAEKWTIEEWLQYDYTSDWGKEDFEDKVYDGKIKVKFPKAWESDSDREKAREIIIENEKLLEIKRTQRIAVMENGSRIDGPFFSNDPSAGDSLKFHYVVTNTDDGHNLPSGSLGAQPEIWLNVALIGPNGKNLWETGYVDGNGDMADLHSLEVASGKVKHDGQLFNLQTKFLTTNVKGTDREMYLPVNLDIDQIPFIRPAGQPTTVMNHPPFIRMEGRSIPPLANRKARYVVPGEFLTQKGKYKLAVRLRSRAEPIYFMRFVGSTKEMEKRMNEWMIDIHPYAVEFEVK